MMPSKFHIFGCLLGIVVFCGCNQFNYYEELMTFKTATTILDCETDNIHLEIIEAGNKDYLGNPLLPLCENDSTCEQLFYSLYLQDTIQFFLIEGYLSKESHGYFDYGCTDSKFFKVVRFEEILNPPTSKYH